MTDIPVDRAGRPMFDGAGNKLSIAEREAAAERDAAAKKGSGRDAIDRAMESALRLIELIKESERFWQRKQGWTTARIEELEADNELLKGMLQTAWNMSDEEFNEALESMG